MMIMVYCCRDDGTEYCILLMMMRVMRAGEEPVLPRHDRVRDWVWVQYKYTLIGC